MKFSGYAIMKKSSPKRGPLKFKLLTFSAGHMKWWSANPQLPHLKQRASKYLRIRTTSASFERCFSRAGLTVSKLRTQLRGEHLEALNVMHCSKVLL